MILLFYIENGILFVLIRIARLDNNMIGEIRERKETIGETREWKETTTYLVYVTKLHGLSLFN